MKIKGVDYVNYVVSDLKKSINFYRNILGLKLTAEGDSWAEFDAGNMSMLLVVGENSKKGSNGTGVAFAVDDVKKTIDKLKVKGVKISTEPWETEVCFCASVEDLDGNTICFHTRKDKTVG